MKHRKMRKYMEQSKQYGVVIKWSDGDKGFIALTPEFPGLSAFGGTRKEALRQHQLALEGMVKVLVDDKRVLPEVDKLVY